MRSIPLFAIPMLLCACGGPEVAQDTPATPQGEQPLTTLTATINDCAMQGFGRPTFTCEGVISGGMPPYSFNWTGVSNATILTMMPMGDVLSRANGRCTAGLQAHVQFIARDLMGTTVTTNLFFPCTV
ncbi:hypothetical protein SAMN05443572_101434 [Myxococcus fulvus]|uniref:Lipoprotein n=1 Tax=Myxococcus fulvus TaxID=33 RepID=A0A511T053_MYXFU|nr:hypothetical protein [Myxococcus fulvus]GEN07551.1 hypothetical protein MFU01_25880 [Myxococcus fulvus]SES87323.1 hypothetical protein SAMN05443572_101434 [Myxococcus fulvus]